MFVENEIAMRKMLKLPEFIPRPDVEEPEVDDDGNRVPPRPQQKTPLPQVAVELVNRFEVLLKGRSPTRDLSTAQLALVLAFSEQIEHLASMSQPKPTPPKI